jgi:hypothetical protein
MKAAVRLIAAWALMGSVPALAGDDIRVEDLAWLAGTWEARTGPSWTEERWAPPRGGVMLGTSLSGEGTAAQGYEFMRIAADAEGTIAFWGSPGGKPAVPFRLVSASKAELVFENPRHDYPTRIVYRREGAALTATISGPGGANAMRWRYRRR